MTVGAQQGCTVGDAKFCGGSAKSDPPAERLTTKSYGEIVGGASPVTAVAVREWMRWTATGNLYINAGSSILKLDKMNDALTTLFIHALNCDVIVPLERAIDEATQP